MNINNNSNFNNSVFMKNETLKNMLVRISEQAQKESSIKDSKDLDLSLEFEDGHVYQKDKVFKDESHLNYQVEDKLIEFNIKDEENFGNYNANFTQEFVRERYKNFIPSRFTTPTDFSKNFNLPFNSNSRAQEKGHGNQPSNESFPNKKPSPPLAELMNSKINLEKFFHFSQTLKISEWIKMFNELNNKEQISLKNLPQIIANDKGDNIVSKLESFFSNYTLNAKKNVIICQVDKIRIIDWLFIIEVIDITLGKVEMLVMPKDFQPSSHESSVQVNTQIKEDQFFIGQVVIIKTDSLVEMKGPFDDVILRVSLNDIKG